MSIDIGVIGMQGKATETRKTLILTKNNNNKKKQKTINTIKSHLKKKVLR